MKGEAKVNERGNPRYMGLNRYSMIAFALFFASIRFRLSRASQCAGLFR